MDEPRKKSFEFVQDTAKLLITLASGVIAFTVTFGKELGSFAPKSDGEFFFLFAGWLLFLASVGGGIWTLLALVTVLEPKSRGTDYSPTIQNKMIKIPFGLQLIFFGCGIFAIVVYGMIKLAG